MEFLVVIICSSTVFTAVEIKKIFARKNVKDQF